MNEGASRLDDGTLLDADLVVVGIGVAPRFGLAQAAGIAVDGGRDLSTGVPDIFAARTSLAGLIAPARSVVSEATGVAGNAATAVVRRPFDVPASDKVPLAENSLMISRARARARAHGRA